MVKSLTSFASILLLLFVFTGCDTTPKRIAYTSLSVVASTVDASRGAYVDAYKAGKVTPENHAKVVDIDKKYTASMLTAINLAQYNWSAAASQEVINLAQDLITTIKEVTR